MTVEIERKTAKEIKKKRRTLSDEINLTLMDHDILHFNVYEIRVGSKVIGYHESVGGLQLYSFIL